MQSIRLLFYVVFRTEIRSRKKQLRELLQHSTLNAKKKHGQKTSYLFLLCAARWYRYLSTLYSRTSTSVVEMMDLAGLPSHKY